MKEKPDVLQGTLALMVLKTLDVLGPQHGWGIARRVEQISEDLLAVNQGTLYPLLLRLENEGSIASEWGASENNRRARFYRLTAAGRKQLQAETRDWEQMALGIGATTAIFSVVDPTLLHPLSYPKPDQLVRIEDDLPGVGALDAGLSVPELKDFQRSGIFQHVSGDWSRSANLTGSSQPLRIPFKMLAPNYLALLGVNPQLGSTFDLHDETPESPSKRSSAMGCGSERLAATRIFWARVCDSTKTNLMSSASCLPVFAMREEQRRKGTPICGRQQASRAFLSPRQCATYGSLREPSRASLHA
jgi:PadR family transcriptional regulator, regulatory protein PadR